MPRAAAHAAGGDSRRVLLVSTAVAVAGLVAIVAMQVRSLMTTESSRPAYRLLTLERQLNAIGDDVMAPFLADAERALAVPPASIGGGRGGPIEAGADWRPVQAAVEPAAEHFARQRMRGVARYFVVVLSHRVEGGQATFGRLAFEFDPETRRMVTAAGAPEFDAIHSVAAPLMPAVRTGETVEPRLVGGDRSPGAHIVVKPIVDAAGRMVALAGLVVDAASFRDAYVKPVLAASARRRLAGGFESGVVSLRDAVGASIVATGQRDANAPADAQSPLGRVVFTDWTLQFRSSGLTVAQRARRALVLDIAGWAAATACLAGGVGLALRASARELALSRMKADFVSNVTHELKTPLASIRALGELLRIGAARDPDKAMVYGAAIETESRRLSRLVDDILDLARFESGRAVYRFEPADLGDVAAGALGAFEAAARERGFAVTLERAGDLDPVWIDRDAVARALLNLLDNATKYSGDSRSVRVAVRRLSGEVALSVSDDGIGIPAPERARIFERFHRVGTGLVHDVKGAGLGLAIVSHIVEAHRGRVSVVSEVGRGSTFTLAFPAGSFAGGST